MKKTVDPRCTQQTSKKTVVFLLYSFASLIVAMGAGYTIYSLYTNVYLLVMNNAVPGAVFGIIITFLGIRYLWAVYKLSLKLDSPEAVFSWMNYRLSSKKGMR
jgi:hypothetical protein